MAASLMQAPTDGVAHTSHEPPQDTFKSATMKAYRFTEDMAEVQFRVVLACERYDGGQS